MNTAQTMFCQSQAFQAEKIKKKQDFGWYFLFEKKPSVSKKD